MQKEINLVFYKQGLRSFISVDLCSECPRQDNKGCCGFYSPVFYPTDIYFIRKKDPALLEYIQSLPHLTILDASITVNSLTDVDESFRCQFHHTQEGCFLPMELRESICRHFVCPGIGWWKEESLLEWKKYFDKLADYEIELNNSIAAQIEARHLSLRNQEDWSAILDLIDQMVRNAIACHEISADHLPPQESVKIIRNLTFGVDWPL